jgi:hypothetical protein
MRETSAAICWPRVADADHDGRPHFINVKVKNTARSSATGR